MRKVVYLGYYEAHRDRNRVDRRQLQMWISDSIIPASAAASFAIGLLAVLFASRIKCPAEVCFFPALLPMIPGMYAYRTIEALLSCLYHTQEEAFSHYFYLFAFNGLTCAFIILGMVIGATIPIFLLKKLSFTATR